MAGQVGSACWAVRGVAVAVGASEERGEVEGVVGRAVFEDLLGQVFGRRGPCVEGICHDCFFSPFLSFLFLPLAFFLVSSVTSGNDLFDMGSLKRWRGR